MRQDEIRNYMNNTCVWRAQLFHHGKHPDETYYFWDERDALNSVATTWSNAKDKIRIEQQEFVTRVLSNDLLEQELVRIDRIPMPQLIQSRATHF